MSVQNDSDFAGVEVCGFAANVAVVRLRMCDCVFLAQVFPPVDFERMECASFMFLQDPVLVCKLVNWWSAGQPCVLYMTLSGVVIEGVGLGVVGPGHCGRLALHVVCCPGLGTSVPHLVKYNTY
ncbi:MAG TPA: hypothetical protein DDE71_05950 [Tenacibaculum sp.]|nr:hypothetical protein [Tenacibaculum sp.]